MNEGLTEEEVVQHWKNEYGSVTGYSFMIYGPMSLKDNAIVNKGLTLLLLNEGHGDLRFVQVTEEVDTEKAELYDLMRGWNIQWIFPFAIIFKHFRNINTCFCHCIF